MPERSQEQTTPLPRHPNFRSALLPAVLYLIGQLFRVFFSMDPRNGPLSRAMRNRSVEVFVGEDESWPKNTVDSLNIVLGRKRDVLVTATDEEKLALLRSVAELNVKQKLQLSSVACSLSTSDLLHRAGSFRAPEDNGVMDTDDIVVLGASCACVLSSRALRSLSKLTIFR